MADEKPVSYVKILREIRDEINREIAGMSFEEQQRWREQQRAMQSERDAPRSSSGTPPR